MNHILMFVYAFIIVISQIYRDGIPCVFDYNCPEISYYPVRCNVNNICEYNLNVDLVEEIE
ncbi:putative Late nodulin [Medicago truncatula]|uniref:Nodule Cysteine-Rich (NCR) secreted peptide n=1 Tax=Medicago truncatula TaxID=3880 RepID=G7JM81_MEDTR|nr:Nodule Cysteine-Rich (NCR) secreted peptide [Medicago truncatula]AFK44163.1 unknown [Medicago truncatula]RHN60626.1 putative Late nodulin [Medicago truncatula]